MKKMKKKKKEDFLSYIYPDNKIDGENLLEESKEYKIGNSFKCSAETGASEFHLV